MKRLLLFLLAVALIAPSAASAKRGGKGVAGTVAAYDSSSGELTLETRSGRELTALVTDDTRVRSDDDDDDCVRFRDDDEDDCDESDDGISVGDSVRRARIDVVDGEAVWTKLRVDD